MRLILLLLALSLQVAPATVATAETLSKFVPRCGGAFDLCGYVDRANGAELIPFAYERVELFSEGVAAVRIDGRYGYIDTAGDVVIPPQFDLAGPFAHELAEVLVDEHVGVIDRRGAIVVEPQFARAIPFTRSVVIVQEGRWRNRHIPGRESFEGLRRALLGRGGGKGDFGLFNVETGRVTDARYIFGAFETEGRGLIWATEERGHTGPYGLMRADGSWQVEPVFSHAQQLMEGVAVVRGMDGLSGAVDADGNLVIPAEFEWLGYWRGGYGLARKGGREGLVDRAGNLLGGRYFEKVERPGEGALPRVKEGGVWYEIRPDGTLIETTQETAVERAMAAARQRPRPSRRRARGNLECAARATIYRQGGFWGIRGPAGEVLVEAKYEAIDCFANGVAWVPVPEKGLWCPVGPDGKLRGKPECKQTHYPIWISHHGPERFDDDPFVSSVVWMRAFLDHGLNPSRRAPLMVGGGRGQGNRSFPVVCRGAPGSCP